MDKYMDAKKRNEAYNKYVKAKIPKRRRGQAFLIHF